MKRKNLPAFLSALGVVLAASLSGCRVSFPDSNAVRIRLDFSLPGDYPFLKLRSLSQKRPDGSVIGYHADSLSESQKRELIRAGFEEEFEINALVYMYTLDKKTGAWEPVTQYSLGYEVFYKIPGFPVKKESYYPKQPRLLFYEDPRYDDAEIILDTGEKKHTLLLIVIPHDSRIPLRFCQVDINLEECKKTGDPDITYGVLDFGTYLPTLTAKMPPWEEWQTGPLPVNPPPKAEPNAVIPVDYGEKANNGGNQDPETIYVVGKKASRDPI